MLREAKARQISGEPRRRWFHDEDFDLYLWLDAEGEVIGFQLCYDKRDDQHALTWLPDRGVTHHRVDEPEDPSRYGQSAMLVAGDAFPAGRVAAAFFGASVRLDPAIRALVLEKLRASPP